MSYPVSRHEQEISVPANSRYTLPLGNADYIRFHTVPTGVKVKINGGSDGDFLQGEKHQAQPGSGELREVSFENTTGGALTVRVIFGLGEMDVSGVATLTGAVPLPTGAATEAKQDTQITRLNLLGTEVTLAALLAAVATAAKQDTQITRLNLLGTEAKQDTQITRLNLLGTEATLAALLAAVATAAKQDAQTALLTTLASAGTETPDVVSITGSQAFANCREISVENTGAANITITPAGGSARTVVPGKIRTWRTRGPFNKLVTVTVDATGSSADVLTLV